jgi:Zn-dependent M28 family amino/carboxypeptidase
LIPKKRAGFLILLVVVFAAAGCNRGKTTAVANQTPSDQASASASPARPAEPVGPALRIDSAKAWQYVKEIVAIGPRWDGGPGQHKMGEYIHGRLKGDQVEEDPFIADTPAGKISMRNIVAKFPGTKDGIIVVGSHIDTNYPLRNTSFAGANDGGSSTALLLAIADQLRGKKLEGYSVWLAFLDGEESIPSSKPGDLTWSDANSLYGSRHLSQKWEQDGTNKKVKAFLLADMIGDKDLDILRDKKSTEWLEDVVFQAATRLGYQSYFFETENEITDDHNSFSRFGIPVADIVDLHYGYDNAYHHTTDDTIDKLSPKSMQIAGDVILETIRLLNGGAGPSAGPVPVAPSPVPKLPS